MRFCFSIGRRRAIEVNGLFALCIPEAVPGSYGHLAAGELGFSFKANGQIGDAEDIFALSFPHAAAGMG